MDDLLLQADQLMKNDKLHEALELYNQKILDSPNNALGYQGAAFALYRLKNMEKAIEMCKKALSLDSRLAFSHVILAEVYDVLGEIDLSREEIKIAYKIDSESAEVLASYGALLGIDKKFDEAILILEKAANLIPNSYNVHNNLVVAYSHNKDAYKIYEHLMEMHRIRPSISTNIRLVIAYLNSKHVFNILSVLFILATVGAFLFKAWSLLIYSISYIAILISVGLVLKTHSKRKNNN
jgi:tetratricopeptide (TPR) repeat protein